MRARVWELQGVCLFHQKPGLREHAAGGLCRGLQRASALKEDALHNQRSCGVFGTFACTASHCLVLPLRSWPRISKPPERRLAKLAADSCRTHHRRWHSISKMLLLRLPRRALSLTHWDCAIQARPPCGGPERAWPVKRWAGSPTAEWLGTSTLASPPHAIAPTPSKILATKDGKDDPAIPSVPRPRLLSASCLSALPAESVVAGADDTRATVPPCRIGLEHCTAWRCRGSGPESVAPLASGELEAIPAHSGASPNAHGGAASNHQDQDRCATTSGVRWRQSLCQKHDLGRLICLLPVPPASLLQVPSQNGWAIVSVMIHQNFPKPTASAVLRT
jgi:hypothetical protein